MLGVNDVGRAYGPPTDSFNAEVIIKLNSQPGKAFGFQLRNDSNYITHQGMLNLLRDALNNNWAVTIVYNIDPGKNNGILIRVWIAK